MSGLRRTAAAAALATALATTLLAAPAAQAGRSCESRPLEVNTLTQGLALAQRTAAALDASGARVVLLARAGQDLSKYQLRWSHLGFAYRDSPAGPWRVLHKLNACGTAEADLYRQGLAEFFMDSPVRYEAAFVPLPPDWQGRLLPLLADNARGAQLHERRYNMVAYPWSTAYQQSNQWTIETLALAAAEPPATTRPAAQQWLQQQGYQPTVLRLGPLTRLGARMTAANVAFDDHPDALRFSDRIHTVTVDSVFDWLARRTPGTAPTVVR